MGNPNVILLKNEGKGRVKRRKCDEKKRKFWWNIWSLLYRNAEIRYLFSLSNTPRTLPLLFIFGSPATSRDCGACWRHCCRVCDGSGELKHTSLLIAFEFAETHLIILLNQKLECDLESIPCPVWSYLKSNYILFWFSQVHKAQDTATKRGKLLTEDFLFLIRKVPFLKASTFLENLFALCVSSSGIFLKIFITQSH